MAIETITWIDGKVKLIDQTLLPLEFVEIVTDDYKVIADAICRLQVRGAPAIGIAAAFGVVLGVQSMRMSSLADFLSRAEQVIDKLAGTRPTAVNLFWALDRMRAVLATRLESSRQMYEALLTEAQAIMEDDKRICRAMGQYGASLIEDGATLLTHCNAGALATADYGTALGVFYAAQEQGKTIHVYADETRPLLQGARLTAWELMQNDIDVTLICDNMAAAIMKKGKIDAIFVGADRIARNGDAANKIGTYNLAVLAYYHKVPFYVVAPFSTVDIEIASGDEIPIEERSPEEITEAYGRRTAPVDIAVYNPAFDVTPNSLIKALVTEKGLLYPPFADKLIKIKKKS